MSQVNHITEPGKKRRGDGASVSAFTRVSLRIDCVDVLLSQIKIQYASPVQNPTVTQENVLHSILCYMSNFLYKSKDSYNV